MGGPRAETGGRIARHEWPGSPASCIKPIQSAVSERTSLRVLMKVTVSHDRPVEEVKRAVDQSFDDLFKPVTNLPIQLIQDQRTWEGNKLIFSLSAKMGLIRAPIRGTIEISDRDITIDVDLGIFERLIPAAKARDAISNRVRGLLK
jgi:hypothetical protein